jgi:hypothetical protein
VTSWEVVGLGEAVMSTVGSQAVCELELVGRTSAVGFTLVLFLPSAEIEVGATVATSETEDCVGELDALVWATVLSVELTDGAVEICEPVVLGCIDEPTSTFELVPVVAGGENDV